MGFAEKYFALFEPSKNPMGWAKVGFNGTLLSDRDSKTIKDKLRKAGIEVKKLPFQISENILYVRRKDIERTAKILKNVKLKDVVG